MSYTIFNIKDKDNTKDYKNSFMMDTRLVTIYEYNPTNKFDISIYKFTDILNTIPISKNALDICKYINCNDIEIKQKSLDFGLTYKNIFNGDNSSYNARKVLDIIKCDTKPKINKKTLTSISYMKWKIYEINNKNNNNKSYNNEDNISEWIGALSGLVLYYDELDKINNNITNYSIDICKPLTVNEI